MQQLSRLWVCRSGSGYSDIGSLFDGSGVADLGFVFGSWRGVVDPLHFCLIYVALREGCSSAEGFSGSVLFSLFLVSCSGGIGVVDHTLDTWEWTFNSPSGTLQGFLIVSSLLALTYPSP
jgi:hypothetical protein